MENFADFFPRCKSHGKKRRFFSVGLPSRKILPIFSVAFRNGHLHGY